MSAAPPLLHLTVNGRAHALAVAADAPLLGVLRNDLGLNGPKYGCGLGECGACMVLIDGKASRACLSKTSKLDGRTVVTVEGLSAREQDVYAWSFAKAGAVQCGFCMPGMVRTRRSVSGQRRQLASLRNPYP